MSGDHLRIALERLLGKDDRGAHDFAAAAHIRTGLPDTALRNENGTLSLPPPRLKALRNYLHPARGELFLHCPLTILRETQQGTAWEGPLPPVYRAIADKLAAQDYTISFYPHRGDDLGESIRLLQNSHLVRDLSYSEEYNRVTVDAPSLSRMLNSLHPFPAAADHLFRDPQGMKISPELLEGIDRVFAHHAHDAIALLPITHAVPFKPSPDAQYWGFIKGIYPSNAVDILALHYDRVEEQLPTRLLHLPLGVASAIVQGMANIRPPASHLHEEMAGQIFNVLWRRSYDIVRPFPGSAEEAAAVAQHINAELGTAPAACVEHHHNRPYLRLSAEQHAALAMLWGKAHPQSANWVERTHENNVVPLAPRR